MSFSNTDTGSKPADPYKAKNIDHASIKDKVEDLSDFITACKFGMMTTRVGSSGQLVSRCMALAAKVLSLPSSLPSYLTSNPGKWRHRPNLPHQHRVWKNQRHRIRPPHQCLFPQLLWRMGFYQRRLFYHPRSLCCREVLFPRLKGMDG